MLTTARFEFDSQAALDDPLEAVNRKRHIDVFHSRVFPSRAFSDHLESKWDSHLG